MKYSVHHRQIMLYVLPGFVPTEISAAVDVFRVANRLAGCTLYRWDFVSREAGSISSLGGLEVEATAFSETTTAPELLVLLGGSGCTQHADALGRVARWARCRSTQVVVLSGAVITLAKLGFFAGRAVSAHWEDLGFVATNLHDSILEPSIFCTDGRMITSCGCGAAYDVMLHVLSGHHGWEMASYVGDSLIKGDVRYGDAAQRRHLRDRIGSPNAGIVIAIERMGETIDEPVPISEIAKLAGMSGRQLERVFRQYLGKSPLGYYKELRLNKARWLVEQTGLPLVDVAMSCGFNSHSYFAHEYKRRFGVSPGNGRTSIGAVELSTL